MNNTIQDANWKVNFRITESAGLTVFLADYRGRRVLWEGSLPYVTIDHQQQELTPEQEHTEAHGPIWWPLGRASQASEVRIDPFRGGFEIACDFARAPFRYTQMWRFHDDGRLAPWLTIHSGGLHELHTYHPHWRFDFDVLSPRGDAFEHWHDGGWQPVKQEGWFPHAGESAADGTVWRQVDRRSGASVSLRPHQWEDAELYVIRYHEGEWGPFYPQSELGGQPFPAAYVGEESIDREDVTLWYVGHVHYDTAFPFTAGPWIRVAGV